MHESRAQSTVIRAIDDDLVVDQIVEERCALCDDLVSSALVEVIAAPEAKGFHLQASAIFDFYDDIAERRRRERCHVSALADLRALVGEATRDLDSTQISECRPALIDPVVHPRPRPCCRPNVVGLSAQATKERPRADIAIERSAAKPAPVPIRSPDDDSVAEQLVEEVGARRDDLLWTANLEVAVPHVDDSHDHALVFN